MIDVIVAFIFLLILAQFIGRYIINYQIRDTAIEIVYFGIIPIMRIPYNNIAEIRKVTFIEASLMFFPLRFGNRFWGTIVAVRKKKGILKIIVITPDNPDRFISETLQHLPKEAHDGTVS